MIKIKFELNICIYRSKRPLAKEKKQIARVENKSDFTELAVAEIGRANNNKCFSTARNYGTAFRSLQQFMQCKAISVRQISAERMEDYQKWLRQKGVCLNTISCYMSSLRTLYNRAVEKGLTTDEKPFRKVFLSTTPTEKRSISTQEIQKLQQLQLRKGSFAEKARDIFLFSFYALGMPFVDATHLRKEQIRNGIITYSRHKTGQVVRVKLEPCMQHIINKYAREGSEYVFPFLTADTVQQRHKQYIQTLIRYNKELKELARQAGIKSNLSSYVVRHTWASMAHRSNVELPIISKALGHTNTTTTLVYIRELNDSYLVKANKKILQHVNKVKDNPEKQPSLPPPSPKSGIKK